MNDNNSRLYSHEERLKILEYIIQEEAYLHLRCIGFWQQFEKYNVIPRSWQSVMEQFRKYIICNLAQFEIPADEMHKILAGYNQTSQSAFTVAKFDTSDSTSDEECDSTPNLTDLFAEDDQQRELKYNELLLPNDFENEENENNISTEDEDDKCNKRKRDSSSSSSSVEIVAVYKKNDVDVQTNEFKKIEYMDESSPSKLKANENGDGEWLLSDATNTSDDEDKEIEYLNKIETQICTNVCGAKYCKATTLLTETHNYSNEDVEISMEIATDQLNETLQEEEIYDSDTYVNIESPIPENDENLTGNNQISEVESNLIENNEIQEENDLIEEVFIWVNCLLDDY